MGRLAAGIPERQEKHVPYDAKTGRISLSLIRRHGANTKLHSIRISVAYVVNGTESALF